MKATGIRRKTELIHKALEALEYRCVQSDVLKLAGTQPGAVEQFYNRIIIGPEKPAGYSADFLRLLDEPDPDFPDIR